MIAQIFHDFLVFFADHFFKGFLVGCGLLTVIASVLALAEVTVKGFVTLIRGHKPK